MNTSDLIDDFIKNIDPEDVPVQYIKSLILTDFNGARHTLTGERMEDFIANPDTYHVQEAKIVLNVYKMKRAVIEEMDDVQDELNRLYNLRHSKL